MTTSDLHTMYSYLTAEERFRLVLAASFSRRLRRTSTGYRLPASESNSRCRIMPPGHMRSPSWQ